MYSNILFLVVFFFLKKKNNQQMKQKPDLLKFVTCMTLFYLLQTPKFSLTEINLKISVTQLVILQDHTSYNFL